MIRTAREKWEIDLLLGNQENMKYVMWLQSKAEAMDTKWTPDTMSDA
jgi:hypothetical protein